jgi:hypothetical protein
MTASELSFTAPEGATRGWTIVAVLGGATAAAGHVLDPDRMWSNWLLASYYLLGLGLAGLLFVALSYVSGAHWSVAFRRVPEAMAATLPIGAVLVAIGVAARPSLYPWTHMTIGAEEGAFRQLWLTWSFFLVRAVVYLTLWLAFSAAILKISRAQDRGPEHDEGSLAGLRANRRLSAAFIVVFALSFSLASFDWIMSREPAWYSTMFAVYNFAGLFLSGLAVLIIVAVWLASAGPLRHMLRDDHLHDLGKLLFAFSTFWMYIWFSQYMLIWYANIPEETVYFVARTRGPWEPLFFANVALNWAIPFVVLLRRDTKRHRTTLVRVAAIVLIGRWLDLYQMVLPPVLGGTPRLGVLEIGLAAGGAAVFVLALFRGLRRAPVVPVGDPLLLESLHYHA